MKRSLVFTCGSTTLVGAEGTPVKLNTADGTVVPCSAAADEAVGVVEVGGAVGAPVSVCVQGEPSVGLLASGAVKRGQVATVAAAGTSFTAGKTDGAVYMGVFLADGVAGDYIPAMVFPGSKHKA